jgi:hypothetical protein
MPVEIPEAEILGKNNIPFHPPNIVLVLSSRRATATVSSDVYHEPSRSCTAASPRAPYRQLNFVGRSGEQQNAKSIQQAELQQRMLTRPPTGEAARGHQQLPSHPHRKE